MFIHKNQQNSLSETYFYNTVHHSIFVNKAYLKEQFQNGVLLVWPLKVHYYAYKTRYRTGSRSSSTSLTSSPTSLY